jgi:hypothetical protein
MARVRALAELVAKLADFLDQEVSRGFDRGGAFNP